MSSSNPTVSRVFLEPLLESGAMGQFGDKLLEVRRVDIDVGERRILMFQEGGTFKREAALNPAWRCASDGALRAEFFDKNAQVEGKAGSEIRSSITLAASEDASLVAHVEVLATSSWPRTKDRTEEWILFRPHRARGIE